MRAHLWSEGEVRAKCTGVPEALEGGGQGNVRVVEVEGVGSYPYGGTHLPRTGDIGTVEVRSIQWQEGVTKISYRIGQTERTSKRSNKATENDRTVLPCLEFQASLDYIKKYFDHDDGGKTQKGD